MYDSRVLEFTFNNILLPDSTTNERESHGFVFFDLDAPKNLPPGTRIENTAAIYFDYNKPIITNTVLNTIAAPDVTTQLTLRACGSIEYNGTLYTENTVVTDTIPQMLNDSIVIAQLEIWPELTVELIETYCEGDNPMPAGNYTYTYEDQNGCDSTVLLEIIVLENFNTTVTIPLQSGAIYQGQVYTMDTTFTTVYQSANGCDSIVTTQIDILTSLNNLTKEQWQIQVFPNPGSGLFHVRLEGEAPDQYDWELMDMTGKSIRLDQHQGTNQKHFELHLEHLPDGVYHLLLRSRQGVRATRMVKLRS